MNTSTYKKRKGGKRHQQAFKRWQRKQSQSQPGIIQNEHPELQKMIIQNEELDRKIQQTRNEIQNLKSKQSEVNIQEILMLQRVPKPISPIPTNEKSFIKWHIEEHNIKPVIKSWKDVPKIPHDLEDEPLKQNLEIEDSIELHPSQDDFYDIEF